MKMIIKNIGLRNSIRNLILAFIFLTLLVTPTFASVNKPIIEKNLSHDEISFGEFVYTSDSSKEQEYIIEVSSYDAKQELFLNTEPFLTISNTKLKLKAKEEIAIKYIISIPEDTPNGTYFNVVSITPKDTQKPTDGSQVGIKKSIGVLFVINVVDSSTTIERIFQKQNNTQLVIENAGFPFIYPMQITYKIVNESNYVFSPVGEIRILDDNGKQLTDRYLINEEEKKLYPKEEINVRWEVDTWKGIQQVLSGKIVVARVYHTTEDIYIADQAQISIVSQVLVFLAIILIILITLFTTLFSLTKRLLLKNKKKEIIINKEKESVKLS